MRNISKNGAESRNGATSLMRPTLVNIKACFAGTPIESSVEQELNYFATKGGKKCEKVYTTVKGLRYTCIEKNGEYCFEYIPSKNETEINVLVSVDGNLGKFAVKIRQKISQNKNFDI